ncbi:MAG: hypothetical protein KatS3mg112_1414 [Thermogutta sp.]|nr:MAG: hypothetical protein KatS3mg112_1414 [Thermogutta sp.]
MDLTLTDGPTCDMSPGTPTTKSGGYSYPGNRISRKSCPAWPFRIVGESPRTRVEWEHEPVNMTADEGLEAERQASRPGPEADALEDAKAFLLVALSAGPRLAKDVGRLAVEAQRGGAQRA